MSDKSEILGGARDPWLWPFAQDSIWNTPIGSGAQLVDAGLIPSGHLSIDREYFCRTAQDDPEVDVRSPVAWHGRWPGTKTVRQMPVPHDYIMPDNGSNNCGAFLMPDGHSTVELNGITRTEPGAQIVGYYAFPYYENDLFGPGYYGSHGASYLSALGGSIRLGELTSDEPIRHAIKMNPFAKQYLFYDDETEGYTWPAVKADGYAAKVYGGTDKNLLMGSLLCVPRELTAESLNLTTEVGKKLLFAMQNYGVYIVDDSYWDCFSLCVEDGVEEEVRAKYGYSIHNATAEDAPAYYADVTSIITSLKIVINNTPDSIGGGGTPCQPLAPNFKE